MVARATTLLSIWAFLAFGSTVHAKGSDGIVELKGTVRDVVDSGDKVSLRFTGEFVFTFFTATRADSARKPVHLEFDVHDLTVEMPAFGESRGDVGDPLIVNFANVAAQTLAASQTGEVVRISLFTPKLLFTVGGVLNNVTCKVSQVIPESIYERLRQ
jgi:hypothetical protein